MTIPFFLFLFLDALVEKFLDLEGGADILQGDHMVVNGGHDHGAHTAAPLEEGAFHTQILNGIELDLPLILAPEACCQEQAITGHLVAFKVNRKTKIMLTIGPQDMAVSVAHHKNPSCSMHPRVNGFVRESFLEGTSLAP